MRFTVRDIPGQPKVATVQVDMLDVPFLHRLRVAWADLICRYNDGFGIIELVTFFATGVMIFAAIAALVALIAPSSKDALSLYWPYLFLLFGIAGISLGVYRNLMYALSIVHAGRDGSYPGGVSMYMWSARARALILLCDAGCEECTCMLEPNGDLVTATEWMRRYPANGPFETPTFWRQWIATRVDQKRGDF